MAAVYCIKALQADKVGSWVVDVKHGTGSVRYDHDGTFSQLPPSLLSPVNPSAARFGKQWQRILCVS